MKTLALLIALAATALIPLALMTLTLGLASFIVWDIIPVGWGFLRVGLGLGVFLVAAVACDEDFREIFKE
jgi:hypothetical protein